jgi:hypothetical protein
MEYCAFVVARTIDIETAPLTPSIARRFTSAQSSDSWCWGIGPCDSRASRSGFSQCLGCFTSVFPLSILDGDCFSPSSTWSVAFLRADTQAGGATRRIAHLEILQAIVQGLQHGEHGLVGAFSAASVSCSAIMHRAPLNRNPWNRSYHRTSIIHIVLFH